VFPVPPTPGASHFPPPPDPPAFPVAIDGLPDPPPPPPADVIVENTEFTLKFLEVLLEADPAPPAPIVIGIDAPQTGNDVQVLKPPAPPPPPPDHVPPPPPPRYY
jgi:hypothetical protein